jgi:TRAP-type C4-dicarboxylate transport system permease small subunit
VKNPKQLLPVRALIFIGIRFRGAVNLLSIGSGKIASYAIFGMTLLVTIDVTMRFLLGHGTKAAVEFSSYLLVLIIFFGLAYTQREGRHITVDALVKRFPGKVQDWFKVISLALFLSYTIILCWLTWSFFLASYKYKTTSLSALDVQVWPYQLFMPLGLALISLLLVYDIYNKIRSLIRKKEL